MLTPSLAPLLSPLQLDLCQAAYCVSTIDWTCTTCDSGVILEAVVSNKGARALVGMDTTTKNLFVAYRGSENIQNWINNVSSSGLLFHSDKRFWQRVSCHL